MEHFDKAVQYTERYADCRLFLQEAEDTHEEFHFAGLIVIDKEEFLVFAASEPSRPNGNAIICREVLSVPTDEKLNEGSRVNLEIVDDDYTLSQAKIALDAINDWLDENDPTA